MCQIKKLSEISVSESCFLYVATIINTLLRKLNGHLNKDTNWCFLLLKYLIWEHISIFVNKRSPLENLRIELYIKWWYISVMALPQYFYFFSKFQFNMELLFAFKLYIQYYIFHEDIIWQTLLFLYKVIILKVSAQSSKFILEKSKMKTWVSSHLRKSLRYYLLMVQFNVC